MSRTSNGAAPNSPTHQLSIQRDSSFIPLALVGFVGLAGIAAWLGQPMLCDLCIAEVFFIGNQVATTKVSRGVASEPQSIEAGPLEVKIAENEVQAEDSAVIGRGPAHSEKAAIPETPLLAIDRTPTPPSTDETTTSEVVGIATSEVIAETPKILETSEEPVAVVTAPPEIPERVEYIVRSVPTSPASQPTNIEASIPEPPAVPLETPIPEHVTPNPVPERVEYIKKPRRVSFATPPTPPVSPPRESFAIPAGLRLPPVPVPSSILTPPLSPQIHPIDYYVGIDEGVVEKDREQDDIKALKIDDDWEYCAHELVKVEADNSSDHSLEVEEADQKVRQPDTEEEKQLRDQIREAFEDDIPVITHIEDISEKQSDQERDEESMESSMVVVTLSEGNREEYLVTEESKPSPPDSPHLPACTEDDEPTTISLAQQKPALIILTPETEESRVIYDATNSRLQSFDARAPTTSSDAEVPGTVEEKSVEIFSAPVDSDKNMDTNTSPAKNSGIVFSDPFAVTSEKIKELESEAIEIVQPIHDIIIPSPTTVPPEQKGKVIRGPYIEPDDSDDEAPSPHAVPESEKKTSDELMDEITEILHKDNVEAKTFPDVPEETISDVTEETIGDVAEETIGDVAEKVVSEAARDVIPETAAKNSTEAVSTESAPASPSELVEVVGNVKTEEADGVLSHSKILPTLLVTTPMIPEGEELIIPERKTEDVARPPSSGSKIPSRPSTAKSSGSEAGGSSSSIDFNGQSSSLQRSASAPGSVVRTANSFGDPTLFSSETNANAPATPVATQIVDQEEVLTEGKEVKRLTKIDEELEDWVDVSAELERDLKAYTVLIEEKDNHFTSEDQYIGKAKEKTKIAEKTPEKQAEIRAITPIESTPKRPFPTPLQIQTPPKVYNPVPESEYFRTIPRVPSLTQKPGSRRVHFDIDDMVAPDSPMFILPIPPSTYGDRPGSRDSAFLRPTSRDSAFSTLSYLDRSLDSINFPVMPKFPPLTIAPRMESAILVRDTMSVRSGTSEIGIESAWRPSGEAMKYYNSGLSDWGNRIDLERGNLHGAKPSHDFAKDRDIAEWVNITREEAKSAAELQRNQDKGPFLPLHRSVTESEGGASRPRRWTLLRALSIPFSAFRLSTDSPRSPTTPNSATYPQTPNSVTSPRETSGFLNQSSPLSPSTPASPNYPSSSLLSPDSALSPVDPIEPIIPNPNNQPLPIRFLKRLSPKGLISGASGAARKAWGLVKYLTSPAPTHAPVPAASGVVERKQSINWLRGMDEMESGGVKMEAGKGTDVNEGVLIDFGDEERRSRAREAGKRAALEGIEELREVVVVPISTA